jgi:hypothetical protein
MVGKKRGKLHALRTHPTVVCPEVMAHRTVGWREDEKARRQIKLAGAPRRYHRPWHLIPLNSERVPAKDFKYNG